MSDILLSPNTSGGRPAAVPQEPPADSVTTGSAKQPSSTPPLRPKTVMECLKDVIQSIPVPSFAMLPEYEFAFRGNKEGSPLQTFLRANAVAYNFFPDNNTENVKLRNSLRRAYSTMSGHGTTDEMPPIFRKISPDKACCLLRALEHALKPGNGPTEKDEKFWFGKAATGLAEFVPKLPAQPLIPIALYEIPPEVRSQKAMESLRYYRGAGAYRVFGGSTEELKEVELFALGALWDRATGDASVLDEVRSRVSALPEWKMVDSLSRESTKEGSFSKVSIEQNRKTGELRISVEMQGSTVTAVGGHEATTQPGRLVIHCPPSQTPEVHHQDIREILNQFRNDTDVNVPFMNRPLVKALLTTGESYDSPDLLYKGLSAHVEIENIKIEGDASWMNLSGARFKNVAFINTNLSNTLFHGATFDAVTFHNVNGQHTHFGSAKISENHSLPPAQFSNGCRFVESLSINGTQSVGVNNCTMTNFQDCNLSDTQMEADLRAANLRGIQHTAFSRAREALEAKRKNLPNIPKGAMALWAGALVVLEDDSEQTLLDAPTKEIFTGFSQEAPGTALVATPKPENLLESLKFTAALPTKSHAVSSPGAGEIDIIEPHTNKGFRLSVRGNGPDFDLVLSTITLQRDNTGGVLSGPPEDTVVFKKTDDAIEELLRRRRMALL